MSLVLDQNELKTFSPSDAAIAQLAEEYMPLTIKGVDDKEGIALVHKARMEVKRYRVDVEKKRKELKADALEYGRKVDAEAKRLTEMLLPIETHLLEQESVVQKELDRIKREKEEAEAAELQRRIDELAKVKADYPLIYIKAWTAKDFEEKLTEATEKYREEQERLEALEAERVFLEAEKEAARRAEEERLAQERAELEKQRAEMEAERQKQEAERQARLKAEREELEKQQAELKRQRDEIEAEKKKAEQERLIKEAAEKARIEAEQKIIREREAQERKEREAKAEQERIEALRPDREKLLAFADEILALKIPKLSKKSVAIEAKVEEIVAEAAQLIRGLI